MQGSTFCLSKPHPCHLSLGFVSGTVLGAEVQRPQATVMLTAWEGTGSQRTTQASADLGLWQADKCYQEQARGAMRAHKEGLHAGQSSREDSLCHHEGAGLWRESRG